MERDSQMHVSKPYILNPKNPRRGMNGERITNAQAVAKHED
jgi:hypothetical protein